MAKVELGEAIVDLKKSQVSALMSLLGEKFQTRLTMLAKSPQFHDILESVTGPDEDLPPVIICKGKNGKQSLIDGADLIYAAHAMDKKSLSTLYVDDEHLPALLRYIARAKRPPELTSEEEDRLLYLAHSDD